MVPAPPVRFSTTRGLPQASLSFGARVRASWSLGLPKAPVTRRTGFVGNVWTVWAPSAVATSDKAAISAMATGQREVRMEREEGRLCAEYSADSIFANPKEEPLSTTDTSERGRVQYEVAPERMPMIPTDRMTPEQNKAAADLAA